MVKHGERIVNPARKQLFCWFGLHDNRTDRKISNMLEHQAF